MGWGWGVSGFPLPGGTPGVSTRRVPAEVSRGSGLFLWGLFAVPLFNGEVPGNAHVLKLQLLAPREAVLTFLPLGSGARGLVALREGGLAVCVLNKVFQPLPFLFRLRCC